MGPTLSFIQYITQPLWARSSGRTWNPRGNSAQSFLWRSSEARREGETRTPVTSIQPCSCQGTEGDEMQEPQEELRTQSEVFRGDLLKEVLVSQLLSPFSRHRGKPSWMHQGFFTANTPSWSTTCRLLKYPKLCSTKWQNIIKTSMLLN